MGLTRGSLEALTTAGYRLDAGNGDGSGYGYGSGYGSGYGNGDGNGYGYGNGYGFDDGSGNGYGPGDGYGYGDGNGNGYGYGSGDGYGFHEAMREAKRITAMLPRARMANTASIGDTVCAAASVATEIGISARGAASIRSTPTVRRYIRS